ncbi:MAG: glycosyltransferase [Geobacteraceae bacterium]|nr:glycosyltransferase [Geobacteraceae bacterium]
MQPEKRVKICFVIDLIESPTAGTEKQLLLLLKYLDRSRFEPFLCVLRSTEWIRTNFDLCSLYIIGTESFGSLSGWKAIYKFSQFLKNEKIDIVQTYFKDGGKVGFVAAKLAGVKTIIGSRRNQGFWYTKKELLIQKMMNSGTSMLIANCENTKQWAVRTEGSKPEKIQVIYNALEIERYYRAPEQQRKLFREKNGFPEDAVIVGIVANLRPIKSVDIFIMAASQVVQSLSNIYFVVIGDGPERAVLEDLCKALDLQSRVRFLGKRTGIPDILSCLDIGVLSSASESFSNSIVEYMAAGLAVVCTDVGGAREAIEDGVHGYVVESGNPAVMADKINAVSNSGAAAAMGQLAREKAIDLFSLSKIIEKYQAFYAEVA